MSYGANVNIHDEVHENALVTTSAYEYKVTAPLLLRDSADMNAQGGFHGTSLRVASKMGHQATARIFLDLGADV